MQSVTGSALKTGLLFLPLIAVPLVAVFGVPDLSKVLAALPQSRHETDLDLDAVGVGQSERYTPHDLFAPYRDTPASDQMPRELITEETSSRQPDSISRPLPEGALSGDWEQAPAYETQPDGAVFDSLPTTTQPPAASPPTVTWPPRTATPNVPPAPAPSTAPTPAPVPVSTPPAPPWASADAQAPNETTAVTPRPLGNAPASAPVPQSWSEATGRLKQLGVRHYQVLPGRQSGQYQFSLLYTPHDRPDATRRFAAEADNALGAVQKVLRQVELWRQREGLAAL